MRSLVLGVLSLLCTGSLAAAQAERIERETLDNGFELLSLADGAAAGGGARVFGTLYVLCGRLDELPGQEGAADLLVETWIAGGSESADGESLRKWLAEHDAALDASVASDHLSIDFHCAPSAVEELYARLRELIARPRYPESEFVAARQALALSVAEDEDEREPYRVLERAALTNRIRAGRLATRASLLAIDRDELIFFHKAFLVADRMLLGLSGAVDAPVLEATRAFASKLPAVETRRTDWGTYLEAPERTTVFLAGGSEPRLWVVARAPAPGEADHALLTWALAGEGAGAYDSARTAAAGLVGAPPRRRLQSSEWHYAALHLESAFEPARAAAALAELARAVEPRSLAALHPAAQAATAVAAPEDRPSARRAIERALLDSIRPAAAKLALAPTPADLEAAAARWIDPARLWVLATGPLDVLEAAFAPHADVRLLDATWSVASTREGLDALERLFAALGGRERHASSRSLATEGEAVLASGESIRTRQVRDLVGRRLWQEQTRGKTVDVTVLDETGATTFRGASARQQPDALHARMLRRSNAHLYQLLHDLAQGAERGVRLARDGALEVLAPDGPLCWIELDPTTHRPARLGWTADAQGDGAVFAYGDWRTFGDWLYPATIEQPELGLRTTTSKFAIDAPLDEALFRRTR